MTTHSSLDQDKFQGIAPEGEKDLRERLIWIINEFDGSRSKYKYLESRFGIAARKWKNVCNRVQQPTIEMLSAIVEVRPYFAAWLMLGYVKNNQQIDPSKADWHKTLLNGFRIESD